jgi:hypothetical protein
VRDEGSSSKEEGSAARDESQKSQTRTLEGSIAPHCKHVFVTGAFCAADASTPVRREPPKNIIPRGSQAEMENGMWRISQHNWKSKEKTER